MHRRLQPLLLAAAACAAVLAGCSSDSEDAAPAACLSGSEEYLSALEAAPGEVRLEGETAISDCLTPSQGGGELSQIGEEMIVTATVLNERARKDPTGPAAVQLGYLAGAVQSGAEGIHADLVRRLGTAANFTPDQELPADFQTGFSEGFEAGSESG